MSFEKLWKKCRLNPDDFQTWTSLLDFVEKEVYRKGVKAIPLSIDLWTAYLDIAMELHHGQPNSESFMRKLYEEAIDAAGLEFRSDPLWEHYISWETAHNRIFLIRCLYDRLLATPTQMYFQNWDSFKKLVEDNHPKDLITDAEFAHFHGQVNPTAAAMRAAIYAASVIKQQQE
ncbi:unnamed protein product, partial [Protopolystoma xenopodis]